ncbi:MAG: hypothetical protein DRP64_07425 [Verrucomicrobia bacterium]|nr:MAG: hypothetical protein DRP64_07425 [Verrucomicrobiota bacterium]
MSVPYGDIYDDFNDITGNGGNYFFADATIDRFANRALEETCERARYKDKAELVNVVGGTAVYPVTSDGYDIFRVEYDDEILYPITREALRHQDRDWATRTGLPRFYYLDEIYASAQNYMTVGLWETPSTSVTNGLRIWYHVVPNAPASTSALTKAVAVDIPEWASSAVLYFMLSLAYKVDTKIQNAGASALYSALYEDVLSRLIIRSNDRQPKTWTSGSASGPTRNVLNRLPQRITP